MASVPEHLLVDIHVYPDRDSEDKVCLSWEQ